MGRPTLNRQILEGFVGTFPKKHFVDGEHVMTELMVGTNEQYVNEQNRVEFKKQYLTVKVFGEQGAKRALSVLPGEYVKLEGRNRYEEWPDEYGKKRLHPYVRTTNLTLLGK